MEPKQKRCVGLKYYDPVCLKVFSFASWVSNTDLLLEIVYDLSQVCEIAQRKLLNLELFHNLLA